MSHSIAETVAAQFARRHNLNPYETKRLRQHLATRQPLPTQRMAERG